MGDLGSLLTSDDSVPQPPWRGNEKHFSLMCHVNAGDCSKVGDKVTFLRNRGSEEEVMMVHVAGK